MTATLKDANGLPRVGELVTFSTVGNLGAFNVSTALTDANGQAVVLLTPASATVNGADLVLAKVTIGTTAVTGTIGFQVSPSSTPVNTGQPTITVGLSTTAITSATPATLTATVKDANGVPLPGQVVKFTTAGTSIGSFSISSALTDANGRAFTTVNPATATSNGADLAIAQATVAGTLVTDSAGFSVTSSGSSVGTPSITLILSTSTVTTATPATLTATVKDATGAGVVGQVVKFSTVDGLGTLTVTSALTDGTGAASTTLVASSATQSGADQVLASTTVNGKDLQASKGFQLTAASVAIASVTADTASLGAYGQTNVLVSLSGFTAGTPVTTSITSGCIASGRAKLTPATVTTTNGLAGFTYLDNGCGATTDTLRVSLVGSASAMSLPIAISAPAANSITFTSATPVSIFLKGSGFVESSTIKFQVLDGSGNGLRDQDVLLQATTFAGGLTLDSGFVDVVRKSDAFGFVQVLINSGTVPTPVRIKASLVATPTITTVSSSLAIAVGLPSQLNFSLSQKTLNIEGYDIDGTTNAYNIIASDRLGNPVPSGTAVNFVTEGGQVEAIKLTTIDATGNARTSANFLSASPRPLDGRITVVAYALGEESFLDLNGNNVWDALEPFQDLGSVYLDRYYNGHYNAITDQFISLSLPGASTAPCNTGAPNNHPLLALDTTIPSIPSTPSFAGFAPPPVPTSCDGTWGKAYVRRAAQTVLSTSSAGPLWNAPPADLYPTNDLFGGTVTAGSNTVTSVLPFYDLTSLAVGQTVLSSYFPTGTTIVSKDAVARTVTLSLPATRAPTAPSSLTPRVYASCVRTPPLIVGYDAAEGQLLQTFLPIGYGGSALYNASTYSFLVADANPVRVNPMAAETTITVTASTGLTAKLLGGSPVPSSPEATFATFSVTFGLTATTGTVTLTFTSPSGLSTSATIPVNQGPPSDDILFSPC
ncbi:MAG: Ig-like domain-containing protein [Caldimonas sp.]